MSKVFVYILFLAGTFSYADDQRSPNCFTAISKEKLEDYPYIEKYSLIETDLNFAKCVNEEPVRKSVPYLCDGQALSFQYRKFVERRQIQMESWVQGKDAPKFPFDRAANEAKVALYWLNKIAKECSHTEN
jgi:hypothetical protein